MRCLFGLHVTTEQFDANAPHCPPNHRRRALVNAHTYIQFDANPSLSYSKVNFWVKNVNL
jgi:hypothetical protein